MSVIHHTMVRTIAGASLLTLVVTLAPATPQPGADLVAATAPAANKSTTVRISSFNVLGHSHTTPKGNKASWPSGRQRMREASDVIRRHRLEIIGFQELQRPQRQVFKDELGKRYRMYPSAELGRKPMANSIAWDRTKWRAVQKKVIAIPYFSTDIDMPYIQLRHRKTGQRVWVFNSHNPADTRGDAKEARHQGFRREAELVNRLREQDPHQPVFSTGDKNATWNYVCRVMPHSPLRPAHGGGMKDGRCQPPDTMRINWIMGTKPARFTDFQALRAPKVNRVTDHPVLVASATVPPSR